MRVLACSERHEKHKQNRKLQKQVAKKQKAPSEPPLVASTSKSAATEPEDATVDRLPADIFAQAAAEEQVQAELEAAAKEKQAASKAKSKKRKALTLPESGSSVTLPCVNRNNSKFPLLLANMRELVVNNRRGDIVAHLPSQDTAPSLVPANPTSKNNAHKLIAPFSKRRKVHNTAAANKVASDGSDLPLSLKRADAQLASDKKKGKKSQKGSKKDKLRPSVDWKARTESTRRSAAMVQGRRDGVGSVHGFVTGQAGRY